MGPQRSETTRCAAMHQSDQSVSCPLTVLPHEPTSFDRLHDFRPQREDAPPARSPVTFALTKEGLMLSRTLRPLAILVAAGLAACSEHPVDPAANTEPNPQPVKETPSFSITPGTVSGPTYPAPGGTIAVGTGNQGRSGGRTWTYSNIDLSRFAVLAWGPSVAVQAGMSSTVLPTLTYNAAASNAASGRAVWTGSTPVHLNTGTWNVQTRFVIQVTDTDGAPLALTEANSAAAEALGLPSGNGAYYLVGTTPYRTNWRFEVLSVGGLTSVYPGGIWVPFLDYYDALQTVSPSFARTSFGAGYYYTLAPCQRGQFYNDTECVDAPAGTFTDTEGATEATPCLEGTYQPNPGQSSCILAPAGSVVATTGAIAAELCPAGTYQPLTGQASCLPAPAGSFVDVTGAVEATLCPAGQYQSASGQVSCVLAPAGNFASGEGNVEASACPAGSYQSAPGQASCILAPIGSYVPTTGAESATLCPAGTTTHVEGAIACVAINVGPTITSITGPAPVVIGGQAQITVHFTDPDAGDTHSVSIDWGNGTTNHANATSGQTFSRSYSVVGVYPLQVTVRDAANESDQMTYEYIVAYDPSAGFVTGGGWINYEASACDGICSGAGRGNFGFVSKYQKGKTIPSGDTRFQFHAGSVIFESTSYEWLVVSGARAQFKGVGSLNGNGGYSFLLTAVDGQVNGGGGVDRFRIKIVHDASGTVVFDNQRGTDDDSPLNTALDKVNGNGSIVIHAKR